MQALQYLVKPLVKIFSGGKSNKKKKKRDGNSEVRSNWASRPGVSPVCLLSQFDPSVEVWLSNAKSLPVSPPLHLSTSGLTHDPNNRNLS